MNRYRIIVADDEKLTRERIVSLLKDYSEFEVVKVASDGLEAVNFIKLYKPDIIFLDIKMPKLNGFDVLNELTKNDYNILVFITAFDEYAIKAFEEEALDYLLKPFDKSRFDKLMKRLLVNLNSKARNKDEVLVVKEKNEIYRVLLNDIIYIQAENNYVQIVLEHKTYQMRSTLRKILEVLDGRFFRIHRSYIVNQDKIGKIKHVKSGDYLFQMINGKSLFSTESYRYSVKRLIT